MVQQRWILLRADGSVASQLIIAGKQTPTETGENPAGLAEVKVKRHGDLVHEHYDAKKGWASDPERKERAERREHLRHLDRADLFDLIVAEVRKQIQDDLVRLVARIAALEGKN